MKNLIFQKYPEAIIEEASNLLDGVALIKQENINVILSDINMPVHNGLEITNFFEKEELKAALIYTTAYDHYAIQAFKNNALDYILKPVDEDELYEAIEKGLKNNDSQNQVIDNIKKAFDKMTINKISLEVPKGYMFMAPDEVVLFEADGMYTYVHLLNGKKELISKPLKHFVDQLESNVLFYRPQRSYLINLKHIKEVKKDEALYIVMENDKSITVSRDKKKSFMELLEKVF
ncbi:two-component response regulator [Nonlabens ulvanivorans]|uniref:Two-component response regulator n=1 Tax=Nonlabens ulvanivorans TaxID=906888 RepID=A0A090WD59_NONUL|nr:two-component response regulator [Nonlabens ulvanivorans]